MSEKEVRLIDANALLKKKREMELCFAVPAWEIENAPTIDPESLRPKAKWKLHDNGNGTCSRCGRTSVAVWDFDNQLNYCPDCGAKMEE
jgi:hypothetical protein